MIARRASLRCHGSRRMNGRMSTSSIGPGAGRAAAGRGEVGGRDEPGADADRSDMIIVMTVVRCSRNPGRSPAKNPPASPGPGPRFNGRAVVTPPARRAAPPSGARPQGTRGRVPCEADPRDAGAIGGGDQRALAAAALVDRRRRHDHAIAGHEQIGQGRGQRQVDAAHVEGGAAAGRDHLVAARGERRDQPPAGVAGADDDRAAHDSTAHCGASSRALALAAAAAASSPSLASHAARMA